MSAVLDPIANAPADLLASTRGGVDAAGRLLALIKSHVEALVAPSGRIDRTLADDHQVVMHAFAWYATTAESLRQMHGWAARLDGAGQFGDVERLILLSAFGEGLAQLRGGVVMAQGEIARPGDFGLTAADTDPIFAPHEPLILAGTQPHVAVAIAQHAASGAFGTAGLADETLQMMRDEFRRFADAKIAPECHAWHLEDRLIPIALVEEMAELGVFGLTIPEQYGGLGLGKLAMCVVTEELSRGYIGTGSLGTRSEIAGELIASAGTEAQKERLLPAIACGEILPTAVFTEPNAGSDLASLKTRAVLEGETYHVTGAKTWITHAARTDLMTMMVRTNPDEKGYKGLSMLLAEKPRGTEADPFPAQGMTGSEIEVLGYRGMKEYELSFDGFKVPADALLGGREGEGFKQLMATFESARIQTAARAVGVAQNAMETAIRYAAERSQFGRPLSAFPRVASKIGKMAVDTMVARQLTYHAARQKDSGRRCDIEAGMAKLIGARTAWATADNALQVHGGNGFSLEYEISRILCDARILNIFEGAAEIQAQVVARGLLEGRN